MSINTVEVELFRHPIYAAYAANKYGEIFSLKFGKIKSIGSRVSKAGYLRFTICIGGRAKSYLTHRFVYECINNEILDRNIEIDHIDRNPKNNNISNLRKVSRITNCLNRFENKEVDRLPYDAIKVIQYNSHKFKDYYFSPRTNCLYKYSDDDYLFEIPFKTQDRATIYSTENRSVRITLNKLREILGC